MNCLTAVGEPVFRQLLLPCLGVGGVGKVARGLWTCFLGPFSGPRQGVPNYFEKEDLHAIMVVRVLVDRENILWPNSYKEFSSTLNRHAIFFIGEPVHI